MMNWETLLEQMRTGSVSALSRLITLVADRAAGWQEAMKDLYPDLRYAPAIGITGYPGSGKSSLTGQLARELAGREKRVGVISIDPSSHRSGGAFLGDRIRMNPNLPGLEGVYIRSMASRGAIGGIHPAVRDVIKILDVFGKDYILVETVGVGQEEIDITLATQLVLLVCAPGQGDAIQYLKAGLMEMVDIYVANKVDLPEAEAMLHNLNGILMQEESKSDCGHAPIIKTNALQGEGIAELAGTIEKKAGANHSREIWKRRIAIQDVVSLVRERLEAEIGPSQWVKETEGESALNAILTGRSDPYLVADEMMAKVLEKLIKKY